MNLFQDYETARKKIANKDDTSLKDKINEFLKKSKEYKEFELQYILTNNKNSKDSIAIAFMADEIIQINPYNMHIEEISEWAYNFDEDFLKILEEGKTINYISMQGHFNIWMFLENNYPNDVTYKKGTQIYLKYCKQHKITKEAIDKDNGFNDTPNIMRYYKENKDIQR